MDHAIYDKRGYPIVEVREGYGEWVRTYPSSVNLGFLCGKSKRSSRSINPK